MINSYELTDEIELIAEAGDPEDALDLMRRLAREDQVQMAIAIRRTVLPGDVLDRDALRLMVQRRRRAEAEQRLYDQRMAPRVAALNEALGLLGL